MDEENENDEVDEFDFCDKKAKKESADSKKEPLTTNASKVQNNNPANKQVNTLDLGLPTSDSKSVNSAQIVEQKSNNTNNLLLPN